MSLQDIISKTSEYLSVPAVVKYEYSIMNHLADEFNTSGYDIEKRDRIIVVRKKGTTSSKIVTAHIDRHGLVVNNDGKPEYAAFNAKKYYGDENNSSEAIFKKIGQRFVDESVYAYDQTGKRIEEGKVKGFSYDFDAKDLVFDIDGFDKLPVGTPISYVSPLVKEAGNLSSQIDNAISVAVAYQLVQDGFDGTLLFATEEEIGRSWQHIANYLQSQDTASREIITLDTTPYDDARAISEGLIVFRNRDENGEFNPNLVERLRTACDEQDIKYEMKDEVIEAQNAQLPEGTKPKKLGKTELGRVIQYTDGKFNGATVQIPTTRFHTNHETTSELALNNYYEALKRLL
jgi:putative aminopeptidase FrvX